MGKLPKIAGFYILTILTGLFLFSAMVGTSFAQAPSSGQNSTLITPALMVADFGCPTGVTLQNSVTFSSSTTLTSDVCAYTVTVDKGVTVNVGAYNITAIEEFINNGVVENRNGGAAGSSYSDAGGNGNGANGPDTSALTGTSYSGGNGGSANYQAWFEAWGSGGAGGGGANAYGGSNGNTGNSKGGNYGGGGGGGGAWAGEGIDGGSGVGGDGGGYIYIYANRFINNGLITAAGHNASSTSVWAGGGGGGGFVYIEITTENPEDIVLGHIDVNGGNAAKDKSSTYCGGGGGGGGGVIEVYSEPGVLTPNTYTGSDGNLVAEGGSASKGPCETGTGGSNGEIAIVNLPAVPPPSGCSPPTGIYSQRQGYCIYVNSTTITTNNNALGGNLVQSYNYTSASATTANQLSYEEQNAQWLLTCPLAPNPESTLEYFNSSPGFVYGNRCLAPTNQLTTKIIVNTTVSWSFNSIANSTTNVIITNPGTLSVSNLGFAGAVELPNSTYAISNAYNTESYIFKSPPSDNASGIWSWNFEFVNFSKLTSGQIASLSQKQREFPKPGSTFPYLQYYNSTSGCTYNYTYSESVDFKGISNEKIPIPINLNKLLPDRIVFNNGTKAETSNAQRAGTGCAQWLFWNGAFGHSGSPCSFGVTNVDEDAAFYLSNSLQPGPTGASGYNYAECYGLLGLASNPTDCNGGSNVYTANDVVNGVNKYANDYIVATVTSYSCDVFFTCYNYEAYVIPSSQLQFKNVSAIPYLLYNFSAPATTSDVNGRVRYLNESYDLYSPHNYLNPNSLDQFTLGVGESMFATIINSTGSYFVEFPYSSASTQSNTVFSDPNPDFVSALNSSQQASETSSSNPLATLLSKPIGLFKSGNIRSPSYAVSTPNDYVYIINHTTSSGVFNTNTISYIYTVRMIPYGYYNLTNLQPNFAVNAISSNSLYPTNSSWYDAWVSYWKDSLAEQSQNYYVTNLTTITDSNTYACLSWTFSCVNGKDAKFTDFIPTYVTSDYADDIFLAGLDTAKNNDLELAAYFSNNSAVSSVISPSNDAGFKLPQDLAATPGGQYIYLSNYSYPNILLFSSNSLAYYGNFSLSYSNPTYNMNITSYLAHGGPFGSSKIASAYANAGNTLDVSSNHHPVAIFDYNNLLYVVDDWSFTVNGLPSSILMLRVFLSNGTEIPINGANYNDLVLNSSAASSLDLNVQNASSKITNPPYGWPISANISISSSDTVSYCAALCTYSPSSTSVNYNGYLPIGPFITALGMTPPALNATGFYIDYNGTVYMLSHVILPNGKSCSPATRFGPGSCTPNYKGLYTEFLRFKPLVENYTKIALASYSPYDCLINVSATSSPCTNNPYLSDLYPPFTVNPSPIKFVLGEGSASNYYDAASLSSSLFPGGLSSYSSGYSSTQQSNINSESSSTALSNSLVTSSSPIPTIPSVNNAKFITLTSTVGGYALIPYNASYTITKSWNLISTDPSGCTNVLPKSTTLVYNGIAVLQVNATPSSANTLVEGGPTYIKDLDSNNFYNANLSDNNSIISPSTAYALFTNRLLGAITINRTENRNGVLSAPQIINYTRLYNYSLYDIVQLVNGKEYPGYAYSNVILANISSTPPSNVPVYGVANSLISNPNIFPGSNILEYANSSTTESVNIFQEFTYFKYYDLMSLSYPNDGQILGYNRLIYKLQDAFNNTVYAPIDVDIANTTIITLNINPVVNALNANQTQLNITGTAGYISGLYTKSFSPLPPNSQIYLYYDNPLEYYNATESPVVSSEASAYYRYALNCTFGDNPGQGCQFANPIDTLQQGTAGAVEADNITYHAQFNNTDVCPQPSKKGLLNATIPIDCSIYNDTAVVAPNAVVGNIPAAPYWRFCQPDYINGTGSLTSQIGLAAIVKTNNTGGFSSNTITACGSGTAQVIAKYFGGPGPEPVKYSQPAISNSISLLSSSQPYVTTYEYNYTVAPNETTASFSIGSYYLSMGKIGIIATILAIGAVLAYQISSRRNGKKSNKRASKGAPR